MESLRVTAPATEIVRVGEVLRCLARDDAEGFAALFDPLSPRLRVAGVAREHAAALREFGLVDGDGDGLVGRHRIRRLGERFYVMELGGGPEYVQDVWPESDALLDVLARAPVGAVADVGTGCGVHAIEAAARGHRVVATDLYDSALSLARFNAILNGVQVDFRRGHLFEPLAKDAFDLVLTCPHYGREFDQLRLEVLRDGPSVLADGGRLALGSMFEWAGDGPLAIEPLLRALAQRRFSSTVRPIISEVKQHWNWRSTGDVPRLVSRHRFLIEIVRDGRGALDVARPESMPERVHVPLARLREAPAGAAWTIVGGDDVAALERLCAQLDQHELTFDAPLPSLLVDACRFGARPCVAPRGQAAGAILDGDGGVRPCLHGEPMARASDTLAELLASQQAAAAQAFARRGCRECAALSACSRCLFPAPFSDENAYCDFVRAHATTLPRLRRLVETLARLGRAGTTPPLRIRRWAAGEPGTPPFIDPPVLRELATAWRAAEAWLIEPAGAHHLFWMRNGALHDASLDPIAALVGASLADGVPPPLPERIIHRGLRRLAPLLLTY